MPDGLLGILKLCLLAFLYLFFARVLWAVWRQLRATEASADATVMTGMAPVAAPTASPRPSRKARKAARSGSGTELVVITGPAGAGTTYRVVDEMTLGRATGCAISFDDTFVSQLHARLHRDAGAVTVEDLGSTNGTFVNEAPVTAAVALRPGDRLRIGDTTLELR